MHQNSITDLYLLNMCERDDQQGKCSNKSNCSPAINMNYFPIKDTGDKEIFSFKFQQAVGNSP